jgi:glycerol kinase
MARFVLSIDQGTTGSTAAVFNADGNLVTQSSLDFRQIYPKPGWVEHDPEDIWKSVTSTIEQVLASSKVSPRDLAAIGITNQRETLVVWDRDSGKPINNAIVWQCRRTTDYCQKMKKKGLEKIIRKKTGLVIDPYFSASKLRWLLDNVPGAKEKARAGKLAFGTIDTFLLWRLTGGAEHATDVSNASRTQLMNIHTGQWDDELLKIFAIPSSLLPEIRASSGIFGVTKKLSFLPDGLPVSGIAGDQQSALFGQACFAPGEAKCTYGTGSFLLVNSGHKAPIAKSGVLTTVAWKLQKDKHLTYALEGSAFICGAAVQWLRDGLGLINSSSEVEKLAGSVASSDGVEFVPTLTGMGAPYWRPEARGMISGLTRGTTKAHLARATLEGMALQNVDLLLAMQKDLGRKIKILKVDGGASENNLLMQIQSDYLGAQLVRPSLVETTAAGAAFLAGLGVGLWKDFSDIQRVWKKDRTFEPHMTAAQRKARLGKWRVAIERASLVG